MLILLAFSCHGIALFVRFYCLSLRELEYLLLGLVCVFLIFFSSRLLVL
eukprot:UN3209